MVGFNRIRRKREEPAQHCAQAWSGDGRAIFEVRENGAVAVPARWRHGQTAC